MGRLAERTGNTPTPHQVAGALGYERDADSGLYFIGTRYYDPRVGRFLSQDVAQWGVNWYVYAANNPVGNYEVDGQSPGDVIGVVGVIISWGEAIAAPSPATIGGAILDTITELVPGIPGTSVIRHGGEAVDVVKHLDDPPLYHYTDPSGLTHSINTGQITPRPPFNEVYATPTPPSGISDQEMLFAMTGKSNINSAIEIQNPNGWLPAPGKPGGQPQWIHPPPVNITPVGQTYFDFMKNGDPIFVYPVIQR